MTSDSEDRGPRPDEGRDDRRRGGGPRRGARRRGCEFCQRHTDIVDYKDTDLLRHYVSERGKIEARRKVSTCAKHQRAVSQAVKRARHMALLPYTAEHVRVTGVSIGRR